MDYFEEKTKNTRDESRSWQVDDESLQIYQGALNRSFIAKHTDCLPKGEEEKGKQQENKMKHSCKAKAKLVAWANMPYATNEYWVKD